MTPDPSGTTSTEQRRRAQMVERQLRGRGIEDERVLTVMREVPRHRFLPRDLWEAATADDAPPVALLEQLKPGAPLVIPLRRDRHELLVRIRDGREEAFVPVRFVPLVGP